MAITESDRIFGALRCGQLPNADFAWLVIVLVRPRVERRAPSYGPCISEDRKTVTCNSRFSQETHPVA